MSDYAFIDNPSNGPCCCLYHLHRYKTLVAIEGYLQKGAKLKTLRIYAEIIPAWKP